MSRSLEIPLTHLGLEIPAEVQAQAWTAGQATLTVHRHWQLYLNQMSRDTVLAGLLAEYAVTAQAWPPLATADSLGQLVNGTAIDLDAQATASPQGSTAKRLILIPEQSFEPLQLRVPQEWVEIPSWVGDYYLAVAVNPEGDFLQVWGYATHEQILQRGIYHASDRTYCLSDLDLVADIHALWVVRQLNPQEQTRGSVAPITAMSEAELPAFLTELHHRLHTPLDTLYPQSSPRMDLPFTAWSAFLERDDCAQWLANSLTGDLKSILANTLVNRSTNPPENIMDASTTTNHNNAPEFPPTGGVNLSQWLDHLIDQVDQAWESIDAFMGGGSGMIPGFRKLEMVEAGKVCRVKSIHVRSGGFALDSSEQAAPPSTPAAPPAWNANSNLWLDQRVLLVVRAFPEPDGRIGVQVSLLPVDQSQPLPLGLQLRMWSGSGNIVQAERVQVQDGYIQLKVFRSFPGTRFAIQVTIDDFSAVEYFVC